MGNKLSSDSLSLPGSPGKKKSNSRLFKNRLIIPKEQRIQLYQHDNSSIHSCLTLNEPQVSKIYPSTICSNVSLASNATSVTINESIAEAWQPERHHLTRQDARLDSKRRFHAVEGSPYVLPADLQEQDRLELEHMIYSCAFGRSSIGRIFFFLERVN
ncbi:hypothetical protein HK096_001577 [Nowakowskiella sp. JEL0078]|nr:hypothetical protein HK096_001577 [Nowakowskiella sp. JEL0078]